jgi:hypothetical protein
VLQTYVQRFREPKIFFIPKSQDFEPIFRSKNIRRLIVGEIIDHHQLEIFTRLVRQAIQCLLQVISAVMDSHKH